MASEQKKSADPIPPKTHVKKIHKNKNQKPSSHPESPPKESEDPPKPSSKDQQKPPARDHKKPPPQAKGSSASTSLPSVAGILNKPKFSFQRPSGSTSAKRGSGDMPTNSGSESASKKIKFTMGGTPADSHADQEVSTPRDTPLVSNFLFILDIRVFSLLTRCSRAGF